MKTKSQIKRGVSATHIDWSMVPYIRKSFYKHWKDGMTYIENEDFAELDKNEIINSSIEDEYYKRFPKAYKYALDMTEKECKQAIEGFYHNLNN